MTTPLPATIFGPAALQHLVERTLEELSGDPRGGRAGRL